MPIILSAPATEAIQHRVQIEGEYRARIERRLDKDFNDATRDNRMDLVQRVRVAAKLTGKGPWSGLAQFQYAHNLSWTPTLNGSDESADLLQLYAKRAEKGETLTIGRQKINFGSERLIGSLEWVNRSRSFDGIRFQNARFDVFAAQIGVQNLQPQKVRLFGIAAPNGVGTTSLIFKHDEVGGARTDTWTLSHALKRSFSGIDFDFEGAGQFGRNGGKDVEAWALHLQASKALSKTSKISAEWNGASGGRASGSKVRTFDNLYPTNHKFYGLMDMHAWKNMSQLSLAYSTKPRTNLELKFRVANSWLQDSRDAWYSAAGTPNKHGATAFLDATGASGRDLGMEWDFEATWNRTAKETISAGVGLYQPGRFVKLQTGRNQAQLFGYFQYGIKF